MSFHLMSIYLLSFIYCKKCVKISFDKMIM